MTRMGLVTPEDPEFRKILNNPSEFYKKAHHKSDVDTGPLAIHHTLGFSAGKAAPGGYWGGSNIGGAAGTFDGVSKLGKTVLWVPTLTGGVTDPQLGSAPNGMERRGWFSRINDWCFGVAQFRFATSGLVFPAAAGSGNYFVNLPFPMDTEHIRADSTTSLSDPIGFGTIRDSDASPDWSVIVMANTSQQVRMQSDSTAGSNVTHAIPIAWAAGDGFVIRFSYPIAPGS